MDSNSLEKLSPEENQSLNILNKLLENSSLEVITTKEGEFPKIVFSPYKEGEQSVSYSIFFEKKIRYGGVYTSDVPQLIPVLIGNDSQTTERIEQARNDLLLIFACNELNQDILVTYSPMILNNQNFPFVTKQNPMLPSEALRIVGLFLRSKSQFTYNNFEFTNEGAYYLGTANSLLPDMYDYLSLSNASEAEREDDIAYLAQSIFNRCVRVLMAVDKIGYLFYSQQDSDITDHIMYHFDYLTLLLSGALDAEACVAYRAYKLTKPKNEWRVDFNNGEFLKALEATKGNLSEYIIGSHFKDFVCIVSLLRNTIHGTRLTPITYKKSGNLPISFARIPEKKANELLENCNKFASIEAWGFCYLDGVLCIEPYTFARKLVFMTFERINSIAKNTDLSGLFIEGSTIPSKINDRANEDEFLFGNEAVQSFKLLF